MSDMTISVRVSAMIALLASVLTSGECAFSRALAATLRVPEDHPTPRIAMGHAQVGDVILVDEGVYDEALSVRDGVSVEGEGATTVFTREITVREARRLRLRRFRLQGGSVDHHFGIACEDAEVVIEEVSISGFHHGISAERSSLLITDTLVEDAFNVGVFITGRSDAVIDGVRIENGPGTGLLVSQLGTSVQVHDSRIVRNDGAGVRVSQASLDVRWSVIAENGIGAQIDSGEVDLGQADDLGRNSFLDNESMSILAARRVDVAAQGNYWGAPDGPGPGSVSATVRTDPWLRMDPLGDLVVAPRGQRLTTWGSIRRRH